MTESDAQPPARRLRCSDADRERTAVRLRDASGAGYLSMDEVDDRLAGAYAARFGDELDALVRDLPRGATRRPAGGWLTVLATVWAQLRTGGALLLTRHASGPARRRRVVAALAVLGALGLVLAGFEVFDLDGLTELGDDD